MLKLQSYLTEQKNVHMEHLEDLVLNKGIVGAREIFAFLTSLGEMLGGNSKSSMKATVKWDGAPAIFMGVDPADKKFFVAKKGLFNKTPKMYKTDAEIDADISGSLNAKFKTALAEFAKLGLKKGDPREVDHKKPLSKGGSNGKKNLRAVSKKVNRKKGNR